VTIVAAGGVSFAKFDASIRFKKDYKKLDGPIQKLVDAKLLDLLKKPFPGGLKFEKLSGYANPDIYTFHITGNFKCSLEVRKVDGICIAYLRHVGNHDRIDLSP
jgi:mRNA-degrading endonuclease RelE of RelBE toxin-antitoxin system